MNEILRGPSMIAEGPTATCDSPEQSCAPFLVREASDADSGRWDEFVGRNALATPYHRYGWRRAMEEAYGLRTRYLLAEDGADGRIQGVFPTARLPHPFGRGAYCSLPYCDRGEPLAESAVVMQSLLGAVDERDRTRHELRSTLTGQDSIAPGDADDTPTDSGINAGTKVRMLLELPPTEEELEASFKSKLRSQIRKSRKNGLIADAGNTPERVDEFYSVYAENMRDLGSPAHSRRWFASIARHYGADCSIGIVKLNGQPVGAGLLIRCGAVAAIPWASTLREFNRLAPNMLLYWTVLAEAISMGAAQFDFGRSTVDEGTYRFKRQWGAEPVPLRWMSVRDALAGPREVSAQSLQQQSNTRQLAEAVWRRLPVPVATALGARLRPYISL